MPVFNLLFQHQKGQNMGGNSSDHIFRHSTEKKNNKLIDD